MQQELAANEAELGANIKEQVRDTFCLVCLRMLLRVVGRLIPRRFFCCDDGTARPCGVRKWKKRTSWSSGGKKQLKKWDNGYMGT